MMSFKKYISFKWLAPLVILWISALMIVIIDAIIGMPDSIGQIIGYFTLFLGPVISLLMVLFMNLKIDKNSRSKNIFIILKDVSFFIGIHAANLCVFFIIATIIGPIIGPVFGLDN